MAIIVETGAIVANANSYVSRAGYIAYALARGVTVPDEDSADVDLINAMDYLNIQCYIGKLVSPLQPLPWPRKGIIAGDEADDFEHTIPTNLINAQYQLALDSRSGIVLLPSRSADPQILKEKVGPIETTYAEASFTPDLPLASALLAPLLCGQGGFKLRTYRV